MVSQRSDTALMASTTATKEGSQIARFSSTLQLTAEEKEIEEYLDQRLNKPRGSFFDTVIERMERFEPLARSIEELLARNDFKEHVDEAMEANARQCEACSVCSAQTTDIGLSGWWSNSELESPRSGPESLGEYLCLLFSAQ